MENYGIRKADDLSLHIEGFPDAVAVLQLDSEIARRVCDLSLHRDDLDFAFGCLKAINTTPDSDEVDFQQVLWRSAIFHFTKCFGASARFPLKAQTIYKPHPKEAMIAFRYFKNLRNNHFFHDQKFYNQSLPVAILNKRESAFKIAKVVSVSFHPQTLSNGEFGNLYKLISISIEWVEKEFDRNCDLLTEKLESLPYEELEQMPKVKYTAPSVDDLEKVRNKGRRR